MASSFSGRTQGQLQQVLASLSENVPLPPSSDDVEALAAARAINFAAELGFSSVIIEAIIKALKSNEESLATYGHMISAVRPAIDAFRNISFSHSRQRGNAIAHNLDMLDMLVVILCG